MEVNIENPIVVNNLMPVTQAAIVAEIDKLNDVPVNQGIFTIKSCNTWLNEAKGKPVPRSLFLGGVWNEFELCILFADTGVGKSVLSVQIGNEIAKTEKVIYLDFELTDKQFEKRYSSNFKNHYSFPDNFLRAEINPDQADYETAGFSSIEEYINQSIEQVVISTGAKIVIVDNITYLRCETERSKDALPLMKHLNAIKKRYGLSILALAHTPKRSLASPLTQNDLAGSRALLNFCDSCFALGKSAKDERIRYIKQLKYRNTENVYSGDNVAIFEMIKNENFLSLSPVQGVQGVYTSDEREHLKEFSREDREMLKNQAMELKTTGKSQREIARTLGVALGTVNNYLNE